MKSKPKIVFRVDSNKKVGLGHVKRCLALGVKFQEHGHEVLFAGTIDQSFNRLFTELDLKYQCIEDETNSEGDLFHFLDICRRFNAEIVIIDVYAIDDQYYQRMMDEGYYVISMHDTGMPIHVSHMIINANLNAEKIYYQVSDQVTLLLGIDYLMMPKEYWDIEYTGKNLAQVRNILITMGGVDQYDLTTKMLRILNEMKENFTITVIAGPYYENQANIANQINRMKKRVNFIQSPTSLFSYIRDCSIAISSAGQTLYELVALGRPTIGIALEENQTGHLKELSKRGALIELIYQQGEAFEEDLKNRIFQLINNFSQRIHLSDSAAKLIDGRGAERIYCAIAGAYKKGITKKHDSTKNSHCPQDTSL